jgi:hypothetical protein
VLTLEEKFTEGMRAEIEIEDRGGKPVMRLIELAHQPISGAGYPY